MEKYLGQTLPRVVVLLVGLSLPLSVTLSCGGSGAGGIIESDTPRATTVALSPSSATLNAIGATVQLSATVRDQDGQVMAGASVSWTTSASSVASVSSSGLVTAVAIGSATIAATSGSASGSALVTVSVTTLVLSIATSSLANGEVGVAYSASVTASGGSGGYSWSVTSGSLPAGLILNSSGTISGTPTVAGTSTFTVQVASGGSTAAKQLSITIAAGSTSGTSYVSILSWGGNGTLDGKFAEAGGVALDGSGNIWIPDRKNETIQQFDPSGNFLQKFVTTIATAATYDGPSYVGFADDGYLYAMSTSGGWVARYDTNGNEESLGSPRYGAASKLHFAVDPRNGDYVVVFVGAIGKYSGSTLVWQKTLNDLHRATIDSQGNVYVTAYPGIQKYDANGTLVAEVDLGNTWGFLAVDSSDRVYLLSGEVSDRYLKVFDSSLNLLSTYEFGVDCWAYDCNFALAGDGQFLYLSLSASVTREFSNTIHKYERR
ncbi:Ig-like domain-containing protein [Gemmatimonadota bacterium]